jgi:hypothetical protein
MIEFHQTLEDINNATVWDVYFNDRKIGTLRKEEFKKVKGVIHGGKYYLNVLYNDYVLPFKAKPIIKKIVQGALDSFEADLIMNRIKEDVK